MSASAEASHITLNPKPCRMGAQQTCCGVRCDIVPHAAALSCRSRYQGFLVSWMRTCCMCALGRAVALWRAALECALAVSRKLLLNVQKGAILDAMCTSD